RLPPEPARHGRGLAGRHPPRFRTPRSQSGLQRRAQHNPPAELPGAPAPAPLVPPGRALTARDFRAERLRFEPIACRPDGGAKYFRGPNSFPETNGLGDWREEREKTLVAGARRR